jgi:hypothetical protein
MEHVAIQIELRYEGRYLLGFRIPCRFHACHCDFEVLSTPPPGAFTHGLASMNVSAYSVFRSTECLPEQGDPRLHDDDDDDDRHQVKHLPSHAKASASMC